MKSGQIVGIQTAQLEHLAWHANGSVVHRLFARAASPDRLGLGLLRAGLVIVLVWIGALTFANYAADSIVPLVANSPLMSFMYHDPASEYRAYMNGEGELVPAYHAWQASNGTNRRAGAGVRI